MAELTCGVTSASSEPLSFSISAPRPKEFVQEQPTPHHGVKLKLMWRLNFGDFTKKDFVYTLNHKYVRVNGGEGMSHISNEYPTECQPDVDWGPAQCGMAKSHFAGRVVMYISTLREAGYDVLIVSIDNVTLADFNVDPDRVESDLKEEKMKFEATMHCSVREHIGEKSSSTIEIAYTRVDPNERTATLNLEKQNVNYATVAIAVVVVVFVLLLALILFAKRKSIKACVKPQKPRKNLEPIAVEAIKANGENEKLAQQQQQELQHQTQEQQDLV